MLISANANNPVCSSRLDGLINKLVRKIKAAKGEDGDVLPAAGPAERSVIGLFADRAAG